MSAEITAPVSPAAGSVLQAGGHLHGAVSSETTPPLANPERLTAHCEELFELIASLNNILNLYMPAGQEAEHRFPMGELPQEVMEICQRLAKLTELLRGGGAVPERSQRKDRQP